MENSAAAGLRVPLIILTILACGAAIVVARTFLMPVILAFLLALTFSPIRRWAGRRGVPPFVTSVLVVASLLIGSLVCVMALAAPIQHYSENSERIARDVEWKLRGISQAIKEVSEASDKLEELSDAETGGEEPDKVVVEEGSMLSNVAVSAPSIIAQAVFTLVLLFFLLASGDLFYRKIVEVSPTFADKKRAMETTRQIEKKLSRYFLTVTVINSGLGVCIGVTFWLIGMPNPLLFGVAAALLNFIPFVGAIFGVVLSVAIGLVTFDTAGQAAIAGALYFMFTSVEGHFVTPYAVGRRLSLNPVIVLISVAFWGWAWSFIGMFIAVPVLISIRVLSGNIEWLQWLAIFLSSGDSIEEQERLQNRAA